MMQQVADRLGEYFGYFSFVLKCVRLCVDAASG